MPYEPKIKDSSLVPNYLAKKILEHPVVLDDDCGAEGHSPCLPCPWFHHVPMARRHICALFMEPLREYVVNSCDYWDPCHRCCQAFDHKRASQRHVPRTPISKESPKPLYPDENPIPPEDPDFYLCFGCIFEDIPVESSTGTCLLFQRRVPMELNIVGQGVLPRPAVCLNGKCKVTSAVPHAVATLQKYALEVLPPHAPPVGVFPD